MNVAWRTRTTVILVIGLVVLIIASALSFIATHFEPKTEIRIGAVVYAARVADTPSERGRGLSGVPSMGANDALLMAYPQESEWGIWMKDMKVPIDIIWINDKKEIVHIVKNASPESYAKQETFQPKKPARYVLEVAAGSTSKNGIKVGDKAEFDLLQEATE